MAGWLVWMSAGTGCYGMARRGESSEECGWFGLRPDGTHGGRGWGLRGGANAWWWGVGGGPKGRYRVDGSIACSGGERLRWSVGFGGGDTVLMQRRKLLLPCASGSSMHKCIAQLLVSRICSRKTKLPFATCVHGLRAGLGC